MAYLDNCDDAPMAQFGKEIVSFPVSFLVSNCRKITLMGLVLKAARTVHPDVPETMDQHRQVGLFVLYCEQEKFQVAKYLEPLFA
jgi:hypothetical protein